MVTTDFQVPGGMYPPYSEEARGDALFHYTGADGLLGILKNNDIWCTAYHCANDQSELSDGRDLLTPIFKKVTRHLLDNDDERVRIFNGRGVDVFSYAAQFEERITSSFLNFASVYIACFCKPRSEEDYMHGLLSQWRGYGEDGGYAIQFSRKKLIEKKNELNSNSSYKLQDVFYTKNNLLKERVLELEAEYESAYLKFLDSLIELDMGLKSLSDLVGGLSTSAMVQLVEYLSHTKNSHFREENECRLSVLEFNKPGSDSLALEFFNRNGLLVPYIKTPSDFNVADCIDWIVVGPAPRINSRVESVRRMISHLGLDVKVRASQIPYSRH